MTGAPSTPTAEELATLERVMSPKQWPITVTLQHPIEWGKQTITELVFQRGRLGFLKGIQLDPFPPPTEQLITLAARLCGHPVDVIDRLDPDDADEVLSIAVGFIGRCRAGGKRPSG